jgi:hypothetical protein
MQQEETMKRLTTIFICILLIGSAVFADEGQNSEERERSKIKRIPPNTLFENGIYFSGYGAPVIKFTQFGSTYGLLVGGRGGVLINDRFMIGGGGYGFTRNMKETINSEEKELNIGYGGMMLEYHFFPKKLVHFSLGVLAGGGGIGEDDDEDDENDSDRYDGSFYVVEPELNIHLNITRFCRVGIGASYRYIKEIDMFGISDKALSRFSGSVMVAFGWF